MSAVAASAPVAIYTLAAVVLLAPHLKRRAAFFYAGVCLLIAGAYSVGLLR